MDIPKNPSQFNSTPSTLGNTPLPSPSPVSELQLIVGNHYKAQVLGKAEELLPNLPQQTSNQTADLKPASTWLLLIQGKTILADSPDTFSPGQLLQIKMAKDGSLLIQGSPSATATSSGSTTSASNQPPEVRNLLSAIAQVLPKQTSLSSGFAQLAAFAQGSEVSIPALQARIAFSLLKEGLDIAPLLNTRANNASQNPATNPANTGHQTAQLSAPQLAGSTGSLLPVRSDKHLSPTDIATSVKQLLSLSGVFMESSLSKAETPLRAVFQAPIQQIQTILNSVESSTLLGQADLANKAKQLESLMLQAQAFNRPESGQQTQGQPEQQKPTLMARLREALGAQQAEAAGTTAKAGKPASESTLYTQQLRSASPTAPKAPSSTLTDTAPPTLDLKARLMSLAGALVATKDGDTSPPRAGLDGLLQPELLRSPFDFPHQISQNAAKASAILADQELTTGQLLKLLAGMLNRIQFNQLNSLYQSQSGASEGPTQSWFFELPLMLDTQGPQVFNLRIDKQESKDEKQPESKKKQLEWQLALSFEFETLGPVHIQVNLCPPRVSSILWATLPETHNLLLQEQERFKHQLSALGLEIETIQCQQGQPIKKRAEINQSLVDVKA